MKAKMTLRQKAIFNIAIIEAARDGVGLRGILRNPEVKKLSYFSERIAKNQIYALTDAFILSKSGTTRPIYKATKLADQALETYRKVIGERS